MQLGKNGNEGNYQNNSKALEEQEMGGDGGVGGGLVKHAAIQLTAGGSAGSFLLFCAKY